MNGSKRLLLSKYVCLVTKAKKEKNSDLKKKKKKKENSFIEIKNRGP